MLFFVINNNNNMTIINVLQDFHPIFFPKNGARVNFIFSFQFYRNLVNVISESDRGKYK